MRYDYKWVIDGVFDIKLWADKQRLKCIVDGHLNTIYQDCNIEIHFKCNIGILLLISPNWHKSIKNEIGLIEFVVFTKYIAVRY